MAPTPSQRHLALTFGAPERVELVRDLRSAVVECRERGLTASAKWASELLVAIPADYRLAAAQPFPSYKTSTPTSTPEPSAQPARRRPRVSLGDHILPASASFSVAPAATWASPGAAASASALADNDIDPAEADVFDLARTYLDSKELERCAKTLVGCRSKKAKFVRLYATYLAADKKVQEDLPHFIDSKEERMAITPSIYPILEELREESEPYLQYLRGLMYLRLGQRDLALESFIESAHGAPFNWSCWVSIASCISLGDEFVRIKQHLPRNIMQSFFSISVMLDLHSATETMMSTIAELEKIFPTSVHLKASRALVLYHMREFEEAEKAFDEVREVDPFRLEEIEIYSNMLYVMNRKAKLGKMAHEYGGIDKNRAEVCCLIGNYYSAREEHTKAIQYFKRSLQLNRDYLPAWTLMGHEYVELKNSHAAIEAYRRAIDVNPKDYRAWYGLGQTYELLDMHFYAVQYYNRATALRPYDCRMWTALATVYEHLKKLPEAIQSNKRALLGADTSQTMSILAKLGQLQDLDGQYYEASVSHRRLLQIGERENNSVAELAPSYLYVAEYDLDLLHWNDPESGLTDEAKPDTGIGRTLHGSEGADGKCQMGVPLLAADRATAVTQLEKVAASNAPEKVQAETDLRRLRTRQEAPT